MVRANRSTKFAKAPSPAQHAAPKRKLRGWLIPLAATLGPLALWALVHLLGSLSWQLAGQGPTLRAAHSQQEQEPEGEPGAGGPNPLVTYEVFRLLYPRNNAHKRPLVEQSRRTLLYLGDTLRLAHHNAAYLSGRAQELRDRSPFVADRTADEQLDLVGQLEDFNMSALLEVVRGQEAEGAGELDDADGHGHEAWPLPEEPASEEEDESEDEDEDEDEDLVGGGGSRVSGAGALEPAPFADKAHELNRWLTRLVRGEAHFEIPSYPLDAQPASERAGVTHIDADLRYCSHEIRDQAGCGACYAFSWLAYAEWHYCGQTGGRQRVHLSVQHMVDCGSANHLGGCVDGYLTDAREFSHAFGFELEHNYPYVARQNHCQRLEGSLKVRTIDFRRLKVDRQQWERVLSEQPILVEVSLPADIRGHLRGVHPGSNCHRKAGHGMLLLGYGRQNGRPYWLLKNSMGRKWGENGYLRLARDQAVMDSCFRTGFISKLKFQTLDQESYDAFYSSLQFEPELHPTEPAAAST